MSKVIMNSSEFVSRLQTLAARKTFYKNKYPYNLCYINNDKRTSADCVNLLKALFNGYDVNKTTVGYYQSDLSNTGDCTEAGLINQCTDVSTNFKKLDSNPRVLYMSGHIGAYLGKEITLNDGHTYNVIECTASWGGGIMYSWVDADGTRRHYKGCSARNGGWTKHGLPTPWVSFAQSQPTSKYPTLKKGDKGKDVKTLQTLLVAKGYNPNGIDGVFGPGCEKAVKQLQTNCGLTANGIVTDPVWEVLYKQDNAKQDVSKYPVIKRGSTGNYVKLCQTTLNKKGYKCGTADGIFGQKTEDAVCKFQKDFGLKMDGCVGPKTWNKLING